MAARTTPERRLTDATFKLLAKKPWREISLADAARAAKIPLSELRDIVPAKPHLIALLLRRLGDEVAARYKPDRDAQSAHERLFDACMAWFDAAGRRKPAMRALYDGLKSDPLALIEIRDAIVSAAEWLMTLAEADKGPALRLRATALAAILGRATGTWLGDDEDLSKTMARLDADLTRAENLFGKN